MSSTVISPAMFIVTERATGQVLRVTHDETVARKYVGNAVFRVLVR